MVGIIQGNKALGVLCSLVDGGCFADIHHLVHRRVKDDQRLTKVADVVRGIPFHQVIQHLRFYIERPAGQGDLGLTELMNLVGLAVEQMLNAIGRGRGANCGNRLHGWHALRGRQYCRTAQAMAYNDAGRLVVLFEKLTGRQQILDVGGKTGIAEISVTAAEPGEIKPQYANTMLRQSPADTGGGGNILSTGKAMGEQGQPFVIINATDINNSLTFSFIQQQFDLLCSDLGSYPVSRAVMASSMVPPAFAPLRLRNYSGCDAKTKPWINEALQARNLLSREFAVAQGVSRYFEQEEMPYLNLADGGITDNIGVRGSMMSPVAHRGNVEKMAGAFSRKALGKVEQVLVVLVNAQVYPPYPWAVAGDEPGPIETMEASFDAAFNTLTTENIAQARREFLAWGANINAQRTPEQPEVSVHFATLTFNQVDDAARRRKYNGLPTAALDGRQVDALTALGGELLEQSETYQQFLEKVARLARQQQTP